jgi:hypothetical protein
MDDYPDGLTVPSLGNDHSRLAIRLMKPSDHRIALLVE